MADISYLTAFLGGVISFLSPCVLPLVPPYLVYMAGVSLDDLQHPQASVGAVAATGVRYSAAFVPSLLFVAGFTTVFVALGAGASSVGALLRAHQDTLAMVAGAAIIVMGLNFLGLFRLSFLYREARPFWSRAGSGAGLLGAFVMGLAFAFGWTPCIGPILGVILAVAGTQQTVGEGALLLGVYSAGLGAPFIAAAFFVQPFMAFLKRFRSHLGTMEKIMGALLVLTGIAFLTGSMQTFAYWLLETFPGLQSFG